MAVAAALLLAGLPAPARAADGLGGATRYRSTPARTNQARQADGPSFFPQLPALSPEAGRARPGRTAPAVTNRPEAGEPAVTNESWAQKEWDKLEPGEKMNYRYLGMGIIAILLAIGVAYKFLSGSWS